MGDVTYVQVPGGDWTWGETYLYALATYVVACPLDRTCQVGMGWKVLGEPRGEKIRFSGEQEIVVIGAGQLHFRVDDGLGECKVGFIQKSHRLITSTFEF